MQATALSPNIERPPEALDQLFQQHHAAVSRAAYRITGNPMDAEDVLQTVFVRLLRRQDGIDLADAGGTYLHRAAVNAALDLVRAKKRARRVDLGDVEESLVAAESTSGRSHRRELGERLREALALLSPRQAEVFALRYLEELPNLEISRLLGSSQTAIAVVLHRARTRLQKELRGVRS